MFRPLAFLRGVPVAFVAAAQALFLLADPAASSLYANLADQREDRFPAFSSRVDAESGRYGFCRETNIELTGFAVIPHGDRELQVHLRFVRRFVSCKSNVAI